MSKEIARTMSELPKANWRLRTLIKKAETNLCRKELLISIIGDDGQIVTPKHRRIT